MPGRGRPFEKGKVSNPKGRPVGSQNKLTGVVRDLVTPAAPKIVKKIIEAADTHNDAHMQRVFVQHLLALPKFVTPPIPNFPLVIDARTAFAEMAVVIQRMARAELDIDSAGAMIDKLRTLVDTYARVELQQEVEIRRAQEEGDGS
jgi:hypothetical protein